MLLAKRFTSNLNAPMHRRGNCSNSTAAYGRLRSRLYAGFASALLTLSAAACGPSAPSSSPGDDKDRPAPRTGFSVRYEPPAATDRANAAFLRGRRVLEQGAAEVDAFGRAGGVEVVGRSCGGEGSAYDPGARRIEICYDVAPRRHQAALPGAGRSLRGGVARGPRDLAETSRFSRWAQRLKRPERLKAREGKRRPGSAEAGTGLRLS